MCWETHCRNFRRKSGGNFEEGIHDDPDDSRKTYGACSILYPGMLEQLAERIGGDYYMIPSSVHEFLLVPREREQDREELKKMIAEVNRTELPPEEVLSDHLYLYCSREREVRIV